jgi:hypothetical protein
MCHLSLVFGGPHASPTWDTPALGGGSFVTAHIIHLSDSSRTGLTTRVPVVIVGRVLYPPLWHLGSGTFSADSFLCCQSQGTSRGRSARSEVGSDNIFTLLYTCGRLI